jgi:hypothetical protein
MFSKLGLLSRGIDYLKVLRSGRSPGQLIIQMTDACNGTCPQCNMRKSNSFKRSRLPYDEIRRLVDGAAANGVQSLSFTGGEVFLYEDELYEHIRYAVDAGIPLVRTGTNGFMFMNSQRASFADEMKRMAARVRQSGLRNLWISIDSAEDSLHEEMRGLPGVMAGIEKALPYFHAEGIYPAANLGINRNTGGRGVIPQVMQNEETFYEAWVRSFSAFYQRILNMGFTMTNCCYPMSIDPEELDAIYGANSPEAITAFTDAEKTVLFKALMDVIPQYRNKIRIFTPRVSLYALIQQYSGREDFPYPCRGGVDYFFVPAASGNTFPCGFRGADNLGKIYDIDVKALSNHAFCKKCDWECFRDPSELLGYLRDRYISFSFLNRLKKDGKPKEYQKLWQEDVAYYRKCDIFDGRKPIKFKT